MTSNVEPLKLVTVGDDFRFDPDVILEEAKGKKFAELVIIGHLPDGELYVAGSANAGATMILMEHAKRFICFGDED